VKLRTQGGTEYDQAVSLAQFAKKLVFGGRSGVLSTHSVQCPGFPFGSSMPYAVDAEGSPIFFVSRLALHTRNLEKDPRASLFLQEEGGLARMTLLGPVAPAIADEVAERYLMRNPEARQWQDFGDFAYCRLVPSHIYLVEGFGSMGWISTDDYHAACRNT
jgi:putative heme iron utilization protein